MNSRISYLCSGVSFGLFFFFIFKGWLGWAIFSFLICLVNFWAGCIQDDLFE